MNIQSVLDEVVDSVLNLEENPNKTLYDIGGNLRRLAEASPDTFLEFIEKNMDLLSESFQGSTGMLMGGNYHTNLLWALEILSWNKDYLSRVT